ncbi:hypothetical protein HMSSN036_33810 [Paenibacillus macerans]|nr:hypothetical protein HMSSN036_33810 [Paenibacillus macerans]
MAAKTGLVPALQASIRGYQPAPPIPDGSAGLIRDKLRASRRPVLVAGGGVVSSGAAEELVRFAEKAGVPVATTLMGIGAFPSRHPLYLGMLGMHGTYAANRAVHQADLLICLGTRLNDRLSGKAKSFSPTSWKIQVDVDDAELDKISPWI